MPILTSKVTRLDDNKVAIVQIVEHEPQVSHIDDLVRREAHVVGQRNAALLDFETQLVTIRKLIVDASKLGVMPTESVAAEVESNAKAPASVEVKEVAEK